MYAVVREKGNYYYVMGLYNVYRLGSVYNDYIITPLKTRLHENVFFYTLHAWWSENKSSSVFRCLLNVNVDILGIYIYVLLLK